MNMHISFISHEFPPIGGGASSALDAFTKKLAQRGHSVQILTIGMANKVSREKDEFGRSIIRFGVGRKKILAPSAWELLRSYIALRFLTLPHLNNFEPDVITAFFAFPAGHAAIALGARLGIPVVVSLRGSDVPGFSDTRWGLFRFIRTRLLRPVWRHSDLLVANGNNLLKLAEAFIQTNKVVNLPNGVDTEIYHPPRERSMEGPLKILFAGQLIERKRCLEMLEGIERLSRQDIPFSLTIVGEGPLRPSMESFAGHIQKGAQNARIKFMGHIPRDKMPQIYQDHDVLVLLSKAEGISNVLLEALACGLCVIASDAASNDVLTDKKAGIAIDPVTPANISDALLSLAKNHDMRKLMHNAARSLSEGFDWDKTAASFENYVLMISEKKREL